MKCSAAPAAMAEVSEKTGRRSAVNGADRASMTIDALARRTGMTVRNIRAHQSRGLVPPPDGRGRLKPGGARFLPRAAGTVRGRGAGDPRSRGDGGAMGRASRSEADRPRREPGHDALAGRWTDRDPQPPAPARRHGARGARGAARGGARG